MLNRTVTVMTDTTRLATAGLAPARQHSHSA
jgi:hypothetical protein